MYRLRRPSADDLAALAASQADLPLSYGSTGLLAGTPTGSVPPAPDRFRSLHVQRPIGHGRPRFDQAREAIEAWAGHRNAGAVLQPSPAALVEGGVVAIALRIWPLWVTASCRIVEVIDDTSDTEDRFGFVYGTLPHHPASGEERFLVTRDIGTDEVRLEIIALSHQTSLLSRLAGPIGPLIQRLTAGRYLDGFENHRR